MITLKQKKAPKTKVSNLIQEMGVFRRRSLDPFFLPGSVALVGASERPGSVGNTVIQNLKQGGFKGKIFPVNPKQSQIVGLTCYPSLSKIPEKVDLVVITIPASKVPEVVSECVKIGVKGVVVISAGFKEAGPQGIELEKKVFEIARKGNIRMIGPNCLGVMIPHWGLNATFAKSMAKPGHVAFISQSGALCTAILDWSLQENIGFSAFVSLGSMADVGWGDLIDFLGDDPHTQSIVIYMESIGDARAFLSAAREVALTKPIILIKAGQTEAAAKAAASHTGSLAGSAEVMNAAFRRCGVLRVNSIADLFLMTEVLAKQPRPSGSRLGILTNAGGPGVLATDSLILNGGELAPLSKETVNALNQFLPPYWSHNNPVDILGDAGPELYAQSVEVLARDPGIDGLLVILTLQAMTDPVRTAELIREKASSFRKPVLASWMGGPNVARGREILIQANVPCFSYPDTAARVFNYMWKYNRNLETLYETPGMAIDIQEDVRDFQMAHRMIQRVRASGQTILSEVDSKKLLASYGIPVNETRVAQSEDEAVKIAEKMGFPVVLKLHSETITHKTDVGGVWLNIRRAQGVREAFRSIQDSVTQKAGRKHFLGVSVQKMLEKEAYEVILGSSIDPQFGPVLLFGAGGQLVEVFKDYTLGLPPLTSTLAMQMIEGTQINKAFGGVRGRKPVNREALAELMVRFSYLVAEQSWIKEIDINPLFVSSNGLMAVDARVLIHDSKVTEDQLPRLAIRPYPIQYVSDWKMKSGDRITLRPIRPEDERQVVEFHKTLSEDSVYKRYFHVMKLDQRIQHQRLIRICFNDYDREIALVAELKNKRGGGSRILGIARLSRIKKTGSAEFAILVSDSSHGQGLGTELMRRLIQVGRSEKMESIVGSIIPENIAMQKVCEKLGFKLFYDSEERVVQAEIDLNS